MDYYYIYGIVYPIVGMLSLLINTLILKVLFDVNMNPASKEPLRNMVICYFPLILIQGIYYLYSFTFGYGKYMVSDLTRCYCYKVACVSSPFLFDDLLTTFSLHMAVQRLYVLKNKILMPLWLKNRLKWPVYAVVILWSTSLAVFNSLTYECTQRLFSWEDIRTDNRDKSKLKMKDGLYVVSDFVPRDIRSSIWWSVGYNLFVGEQVIVAILPVIANLMLLYSLCSMERNKNSFEFGRHIKDTQYTTQLQTIILLPIILRGIVRLLVMFHSIVNYYFGIDVSFIYMDVVEILLTISYPIIFLLFVLASRQLRNILLSKIKLCYMNCLYKNSV